MKALDIIKPWLFERKWLIFTGMISLILVDFLQLLIPRIIKQAVDGLTLLRIDMQQLSGYGLQILLIGILIGGFRYLWRACLIGSSRRVEEGIRNRLFSHLQTLSPAYFDTVTTGDLMAHATNDLMNIRMAIGMGLVALTDSVVMGGATLGFMAYINIRLTLLAMIPTPLIIFGTRFFSRRIHRIYGNVQNDFSALTETVRERFAGIRLIKAHRCEEQETEKLTEVSRRYIRSNLSLARIDGAFFPMMILFTNLSAAIILYFGGRKTILGQITPGDFVAFISYLNLLTWPMMALGWVSNLIQRGKASADRLQIIFDTLPQVADSPGAVRIQKPEGHIQFRNVSFAYGQRIGAPRPILSRIDIDLTPGRVLGIVGPPGSGKSSLLALVPRLYDVTEGSILLDGIDIRSLVLSDLRGLMAFVPQEPFLFAGTIRDNILLDRAKDREADLVAAAESASLHDTVMSFPKGYDTLVGEKGIILSGGQKQRVALARALLMKAPILLLDDPISQVDTQTGNAIIQAIRTAARGKTVIMASHRLSALTFSDQIITLKDGRIIESGAHPELMAASGYYAETYRMQEIEESLHDG